MSNLTVMQIIFNMMLPASASANVEPTPLIHQTVHMCRGAQNTIDAAMQTAKNPDNMTDALNVACLIKSYSEVAYGCQGLRLPNDIQNSCAAQSTPNLKYVSSGPKL